MRAKTSLGPPGVKATIKDPGAYGLITVQGTGKIGKLALQTPAMIRFGELTEGHPVIPSVEGFPNVFEIDYSKARELYAAYGNVSTRRQGIDWHTDVTFVMRPPLGSILNAKVIPPSGGDTMWSD